MAFDLASAKPATGFDLASAKPVGDDVAAAFAKGEASSLIPGAQPPGAPKEAAGGDLVDTLTAIPSAVVTAAGGTAAAGAGNIVAAVREIASRSLGADLQTGRLEGQQAGEVVTKALTPTPTPGGAKVLGKVGELLDESKLQGLNPAMPLGSVAPGMVKTVGRLAKESPEAELAAKAGRAVAGAAKLPVPAEDVVKLARRAQELGIELRPDMLSDNKFLRMMGEALEDIPLSGSKADQRQAAFNRALGGLIGAEAGTKRITPAVFDRAISKSGKTIGDISAKAEIPLAPNEIGSFDAALSERVEEAKKFETSDVARVLENYADELRAKAQNGVIPGEAFRKINTKIGNQIRTTSNGDLRHALGEFQEDMHDALERSIADPEKLAQLKEARKQYAIAKAIEPLVAKSKYGDISPGGLMSAVTSDKAGKSRMARDRGGELGELARIGQAFIKEQPSSFTTERKLAYGLLGGGAAIHPGVAAGVYGAANVYNRLGPAVARRMTKVRDLDKKKTVRELEGE